jgi:hypothetical protein
MDVLSGFDVGRDRILAIRYYRSSTCSWPWIMRHLTPCTHFHGARGRAPSPHYRDPLCTHNNDPNISAGSPIE